MRRGHAAKAFNDNSYHHLLTPTHEGRDSRIGGNRIHRGKRWRFAMAAAIALRGDCDSGLLRELAKQSEDADQVRRLLALAVVYDGGSRSDGARAASERHF